VTKYNGGELYKVVKCNGGVLFSEELYGLRTIPIEFSYNSKLIFLLLAHVEHKFYKVKIMYVKKLAYHQHILFFKNCPSRLKS
jgi:hypothetical protein